MGAGATNKVVGSFIHC